MATIIGSGLEGHLHRQAREQALNIIAEAREKAAQITRQAQDEAQALRRDSQESAARAIEEKRRQALAKAQLKAKQSAVRCQEEMMERLWAEAEASLRAERDAASRLAILERLILDAAAQLGGGRLLAQVNQADQPLLAGALPRVRAALQAAYPGASLELAASPAPIWGGVIVRRSDANQLVDNSYEERLALAKRTLRDAAYQLLLAPDAAERR